MGAASRKKGPKEAGAAAPQGQAPPAAAKPALHPAAHSPPPAAPAAGRLDPRSSLVRALQQHQQQQQQQPLPRRQAPPTPQDEEQAVPVAGPPELVLATSGPLLLAAVSHPGSYLHPWALHCLADLSTYTDHLLLAALPTLLEALQRVVLDGLEAVALVSEERALPAPAAQHPLDGPLARPPQDWSGAAEHRYRSLLPDPAEVRRAAHCAVVAATTLRNAAALRPNQASISRGGVALAATCLAHAAARERAPPELRRALSDVGVCALELLHQVAPGLALEREVVELVAVLTDLRGGAAAVGLAPAAFDTLAALCLAQPPTRRLVLQQCRSPGALAGVREALTLPYSTLKAEAERGLERAGQLLLGADDPMRQSLAMAAQAQLLCSAMRLLRRLAEAGPEDEGAALRALIAACPRTVAAVVDVATAAAPASPETWGQTMHTGGGRRTLPAGGSLRQSRIGSASFNASLVLAQLAQEPSSWAAVRPHELQLAAAIMGGVAGGQSGDLLQHTLWMLATFQDAASPANAADTWGKAS